MSDVFISYSRKDGDFAKRLSNALARTDHDVWIDWQDIPRAADWLKEIYTGIESADTFVFVVSQHSLISEICNYEVEYALKHSKRIIPLIRQEIKSDTEKQIAGEWYNQTWEALARENWTTLKRLNWIFFNNDTKFDSEFASLLQAMKQDLDYIRAHKRLLVRALEWERGGHNNSTLLVGDEIDIAEDWLIESETKEPKALLLHSDYITESRRIDEKIKTKQALREKRIQQFRHASVGLGMMVILAIIAVMFATSQANSALKTVANAQIELTTVAEDVQQQEIFIQSRDLASAAQQAYALGDSFLALPLALEANKIALPNSPALAQLTLSDLAYQPSARLRFFGHTNSVKSVAFSPDGKTALSGSWDKTLILWDVKTAEKLYTFIGHTGGVQSVAFSPDGKTALSGSNDKTLILWDIESGEQLRTFIGHTYDVTSVTFSPDGKTALSASCGQKENGRCTQGELILWNVEKGEVLRTFVGHSWDVNTVVFSPDGKTALSGASGNNVRPDSDVNLLILWDVETGEQLRTFKGHSTAVNSVTFSSDGKTAISGSNDNTLILWDVETGERLRTFIGHISSVTSVAFSPDGKTAISASDGSFGDSTLILWDVETGDQLWTFTGQSERINSVSFSPDGKTVLSASQDDTLVLWDIARGEVLRTFTGQSERINSVTFSPDGKTALSASCGEYDPEDIRRCIQGELILWDISTGAEIRRFIGHASYVSSVTFSPDGKTALSASCGEQNYSYCLQGELILWDVEVSSATFGVKLRTFLGHSTRIQDVAFSPDGETALSASCGREKNRYCSEGEIILWELASGNILYIFSGHTDNVNSVTFSPDGKTALSSSCGQYCTRGELILWDIETGKNLRTFTGHTDEVWDVAFSPDGKTALSASLDNTIILWDVESGEKLRTFTGHSSSVYSVAFSPDGKTILSGAGYPDNELILWDVETGEKLRRFSEYRANSVAFSPDGKTALSISSGGALKLLRIDTPDELIKWTYKNRYVRNLTCIERRDYRVKPLCKD